MVPDGPLSKTFPGAMWSRRQSFSVSPSDSTSGLVPDTAKIAMRTSDPTTMPVSLTSRSGDLASSADDGTGKRASNEGLSLLGIRPAQTTHAARHKAGNRIIYLSTIRCVSEPGFIDATELRRFPKDETSRYWGRYGTGEFRGKRQPHGSHPRRALRSFPLRITNWMSDVRWCTCHHWLSNSPGWKTATHLQFHTELGPSAGQGRYTASNRARGAMRARLSVRWSPASE